MSRIERWKCDGCDEEQQMGNRRLIRFVWFPTPDEGNHNNVGAYFDLCESCVDRLKMNFPKVMP